MSIARHHADWLSLVEVSGPFLSLPVLLRVFPQGLPARDPELSKETKLMFEDWLDGHKDRAVHIGWCNFVIRNVLQFPPEVIAEGQTIPPGMEAHMSEYGEVLRPSMVILSPKSSGSRKPRLLIQILPPSQDLEKPLRDKLWKASPATRMTELLHAADVPLGLVTNGEHWMLVHAPRGETSGFASWYSPLWFEEPLTFQAFVALLSVERFFGVADDQTIEALLNASAKDQQEVTEQLGWQVRKAVEVLIQSLDKIDQDHHRKLLEGIGEKQLYEAALTVMMRLVFLMCAEERKIFFQSESEQYDQFYAVSTLHDQLQEIADKHVEEVLDARFDAWGRLLATFRAVYSGVQHDAMRLPPYGGTLFDPDRFPFLEGRKPGTNWHTAYAEPIKVSNRTVLHLLNALQILQVKVPGGGAAEARRISFRALDIEQLGHVYEGLLDHTAKRATEPVLGLKGGKDSEPEIALSKLESLKAKSVDELVEFLKEETGRSEKALKKAITDEELIDETHLLIACNHDRDLSYRVRPYAALLREDTLGYPVVINTGSIYVTQGSDRRSTGTHYTPRSLTEPIVQHTLEPLVYVGPAEGTPRDQWKLKSAREILELKVCDMAMGSGAFLVQTCRYMAERLVEAWEKVEKEHPDCFVITPEGELSTGSPDERLLPKDSAERLTIARRFVADRCLYGVDINPMAVEMAKLSLWLITLQRDRPFTFLDHALRYGDSLLGVSSVKQIENFSLRAKAGETVQHTFATANLFRNVEKASAKRRALENLPSNDHTQIETKNRLHIEAEAATAKVKALADCLIAFELLGLDGGQYQLQRAMAADQAELAMRKPLSDFQAYACERLNGRRTFNWPLEFSEVFLHGGFDAFVGNPPFMGGKKITGELGTDYRDYLLHHLANGKRGHADLCAYFFLRAYTLMRSKGSTFGLLATNTIAQGDTREVGLEQLAAVGHLIRAVPSVPWPGTAALEVAHVWFRRGDWLGEHVLGGNRVSGITPFLVPPATVGGKPLRLAANADKSFIGSYVLGMGFVLTPEQAQVLITRNPKHRDVVFPYINGEDLNSRPDQSPSRWVINFFDWPLDRTAKGCWTQATEEQRVDWLAQGNVPNDYPGKVATDYPECLSIVEEKVKPERTRKKPNGEFVLRYPLYARWWIYADKRPALYKAIRQPSRILAKALTSKHHAFAFLPTGMVYDQTRPIFVFSNAKWFAVLQSDLHCQWALEFGASLETRPRYTPSDCFETFPFPPLVQELDFIGERYHTLRSRLMIQAAEGFTKLYNRFHDPKDDTPEIVELRKVQVSLDQAVSLAYGWTDIELEQGFYPTKIGIRYTMRPSARQTVLNRLLALNHERHAEEVSQGLHDKLKKNKVKADTAHDEFPLFGRD